MELKPKLQDFKSWALANGWYILREYPAPCLYVINNNQYILYITSTGTQQIVLLDESNGELYVENI
jgi:hypothetical protein